MDRIAVFFDTNILESRFIGNEKRNYLFHGKITPSNLFYGVLNYVKDLGVNLRVDFYIHEVSWKEFNSHLKENFIKRAKEVQGDFDIYSKSFGEIFDYIHELKIQTKEEYDVYINELGNSFLSDNNCIIINHPNEIDFFTDLLQKCIDKKKPFINFQVKGKQYHDGGFKDAVIIETIRTYKKESNDDCIFITEDKDFDDITDIQVCQNLEAFKECINKIANIRDVEIVKRSILDNEYLIETLIGTTGNEYDKSVESLIVSEIKEEEGAYRVIIQATINEVYYTFSCLYDDSANEFIDIKYQLTNE